MPFYAILSGLILLVLSAGSAASDLSHMLQRMSRVDQNQNYQGVFILRKDDQLSSLRVTHGSDKNGVWETMESLDGEPVNIIRRNNEIVSIYPERQLMTIRHNKNNKSLHQQLPGNLQQLDFFYVIHQLEDDRIANHQTLVVDLAPRDGLRYGYRYWVDKKTGMLLRSDLIDKNQTVLQQMMFTSLDYFLEPPPQPVKVSQFKQYRQKVLDDAVVTVEAAEAGLEADADKSMLQQETASWQVNALPEGFMLTHSNLRHASPLNEDQSHKPGLLHMVYSDGLASVSVFIEEKQSEQSHSLGTSSMGAMNAFGRVLGDYVVTVVGEVPMKTVQLIALSISRKQ